MKIDLPHPDEIDRVGKQIVIHPWDTWDMDYTLSYIITPMLEQLKETKHGYPSNLTLERWNEILDEMIWALRYKRDRFTSVPNEETRNEDQARLNRAFKYFGQYYENLWD